MKDYEDVTFPEPPTLFDDYSTRQPFVADVWMKLSGMTGDGIGVAPTAEEFAAHPQQRMPEFLEVMNPAQRAAWHEVYDPRNREYQELKAAGKLNGKDGVHYIYQRFIKDYVRTIAGLDEDIGRILAYLDETGLSSNTIVIYSSDQGFFTGEHGWAEKRWMYEESFKAPVIMRWPGTIKPGTRIDALTQNIDLAPTLLTVAGIPVPKEVQGLPLQPVLGGNIPAEWRKDVLYTYYDGGTPAARGEYNMPRHMGVRDDRYKLISFYDYKVWEFYDLQQDPHELNNVYDKPEYAKEVARLKERLAALKEQFQVPEPPQLVPKKNNTGGQNKKAKESTTTSNESELKLLYETPEKFTRHLFTGTGHGDFAAQGGGFAQATQRNQPRETGLQRADPTAKTGGTVRQHLAAGLGRWSAGGQAGPSRHAASRRRTCCR